MSNKKNLRNKNDAKSKQEKPKRENVQTKLYNNKELSSKVHNALDKGYTLEEVQELCQAYDFDISIPSLSRYSKAREECVKNGWDLGDYLDKRKKTNVVSIEHKEQDILDTNPNSENHPFNATMSKTRDLLDDVSFLDKIISKGDVGLDEIYTLDPSIAMKAVEIKDKITDGQLKGMSLLGLRELQLKQVAKETAMTETMLEYIPEDQHEEVLNKMQEVEEEFYRNLDLDDEDRKLKESLERIGYSI